MLPLTFENGGIVMWQELLDISKTLTNWETQPRILKLYSNKLGLFPKPWASRQFFYTNMQSLHVMCVKWCWPLYYYHVSMTTLLDCYTEQHCTLFICHILLMSPYRGDVEGEAGWTSSCPYLLHRSMGWSETCHKWWADDYRSYHNTFYFNARIVLEL